MPCSYVETEAEIRARLRKDAGEYKQELDKLTRMLCEAMSTLEHNPVVRFSSELNDWWLNHKKEDAERERKAAAEKAKNQAKIDAANEKYRARLKALDKLTKEDKIALGLE